MCQPDGTIVRVHQGDLCQALSVHPDRKYEVDNGPGATDLGRLVRDVAAPRDRGRLLDALIYNWLLLATDGHAKNFSLLLSGHRARLAPLYDVASGLPHLHPREARMAQKIGGEERPLSIAARHWEKMSVPFGIAGGRTLARIVELIDALPDALADAAVASNFSADEQRIAATIRDLIVGWLRTCRRAIT